MLVLNLSARALGGFLDSCLFLRGYFIPRILVKLLFLDVFFLNCHLFTDFSRYAQHLSVVDSVRMDSRRRDLFLLVPVISLLIWLPLPPPHPPVKAEGKPMVYILSDSFNCSLQRLPCCEQKGWNDDFTHLIPPTCGSSKLRWGVIGGGVPAPCVCACNLCFMWNVNACVCDTSQRRACACVKKTPACMREADMRRRGGI